MNNHEPFCNVSDIMPAAIVVVGALLTVCTALAGLIAMVAR